MTETNRKRGRPKMPPGQRLESIIVRICPADRQMLAEVAEQEQTTIGAVVRGILARERREKNKRIILEVLAEHARQQ